MAVQDNMQIARRLMEEVYMQGNIGLVDEMIDDDVREHEEFAGEHIGGKEGIKAAVAAYKKAFPDLSVTIEDEFAEGDRVFLRTHWHGTHQGEFMGVEPTGREVDFGSMDEVVIQDGRLKEHWGVTDSLRLLTQLGVISPPG